MRSLRLVRVSRVLRLLRAIRVIRRLEDGIRLANAALRGFRLVLPGV